MVGYENVPFRVDLPIVKIIIGAAGFFLSLACIHTSQAASNPEVFMSADVDGRERSVQFDCHE